MSRRAPSALSHSNSTHRNSSPPAAAPHRINNSRRVPRLFFFLFLCVVVACMRLGYRVRCARLLDGPAPCVLAKMLHTETLFLPLQSRQQGLRTPKVFIQEWKPRGDFHQLDARLRLLVYYVSADTTPLMEQDFIMVTQTRRWSRGCVIFYFFSSYPKKADRVKHTLMIRL